MRRLREESTLAHVFGLFNPESTPRRVGMVLPKKVKNNIKTNAGTWKSVRANPKEGNRPLRINSVCSAQINAASSNVIHE
jgi:hypothetical protein